jgi:protein-disulfide isomerase
MKRYWPFVIIAVVLLAAAGAVALMLHNARTQTSTSSTTSSNAGGATAGNAGSPSASPGAAATSDVVTIEEFGDYQCPPCGNLHPILKTIKNDYGDRVKFVFYNYPLTSLHKHALEAAYAASAASLQGKFWEMHDKLYDNQGIWSDVGDFRPIALDFARQLGLDVPRFTRDMDGLKVMGIVSSDNQRATALGVDSTPTVFINGQLIPNERLTAEALRKEIAQRLPTKG